MNPIVRIKEPCQESWNNMTPNSEGRHCAQCCKTVVDFTAWRNEDILNYLRKNAAKKICGRFSTVQATTEPPKIEATPVDVARYIRRSPLSFMQRIAAVVLIGLSVAMSSCEPEPVSVSSIAETAAGKASGVKDSTCTPLMMGEMMPVDMSAADTSQATRPHAISNNPTGEPRILTGAPVEVDGLEPVAPEPVPVPAPPARHLMGKPAVPRVHDPVKPQPVEEREYLKGDMSVVEELK